jgi:hypothetical protein
MGGNGGGGGSGDRSGGGGGGGGESDRSSTGEITYKPYGENGETIKFDQKTSDQIRAVENSIKAGKVGDKELYAVKATTERARKNLETVKSKYTEAQYKQMDKEISRRLDSTDYLLKRVAEIRIYGK